ncbi:thiamine biosynthesis protein ThiS [Pandoraea cepalis]|uniref:Thiamine biosynthesis protein ThiS n=1 Tax=Pandoraea cepalis TaxID=2508294 RepID=A0A5E4XQX8_9BURK|nr:MoaD/ThiS family protein [Pandoraea sp. XY-2]VVE38809.1 thiamine biosynthesis protein ThiS [Pandoraea cepalis]
MQAIRIVYTEGLVLFGRWIRWPQRHPRNQDMATVTFAPAIQRHVCVDDQCIDGPTVHAVLAQCVTLTPELRGYLFNDQGRLRAHVAVFVDGRLIRDRHTLGDTLNDASRVYVAQALSGG